jgi:hypothetical protein
MSTSEVMGFPTRQGDTKDGCIRPAWHAGKSASEVPQLAVSSVCRRGPSALLSPAPSMPPRAAFHRLLDPWDDTSFSTPLQLGRWQNNPG